MSFPSSSDTFGDASQVSGIGWGVFDFWPVVPPRAPPAASSTSHVGDELGNSWKLPIHPRAELCPWDALCCIPRAKAPASPRAVHGLGRELTPPLYSAKLLFCLFSQGNIKFLTKHTRPLLLRYSSKSNKLAFVGKVFSQGFF